MPSGWFPRFEARSTPHVGRDRPADTRRIRSQPPGGVTGYTPGYSTSKLGAAILSAEVLGDVAGERTGQKMSIDFCCSVTESATHAVDDT